MYYDALALLGFGLLEVFVLPPRMQRTTAGQEEYTGLASAAKRTTAGQLQAPGGQEEEEEDEEEEEVGM